MPPLTWRRGELERAEHDVADQGEGCSKEEPNREVVIGFFTVAGLARWPPSSLQV
jgi:hypothetical protein